MEWINSKDDSQRVFRRNWATSHQGEKLYAYEVMSYRGEGWLCAGALLGIKKLSALMERRMLSLVDTEMMLRSIIHPGLIAVGGGHKHGRYFETYRFEDEAETKLPLLFLNLGYSMHGWENLIEQEDKRDEVRKKKRGPSRFSKEYRSLRSWLLNHGGEEGEKLKIALGESSSDDRARVMRQLKSDSLVIQDAYDKLWEPLKVRRANNERASEATKLAKLSLLQNDRQDEERTLYQLFLEEELGKQRRKVAEAEAQLERAKLALKKAKEDCSLTIFHLGYTAEANAYAAEAKAYTAKVNDGKKTGKRKRT